MNAVSRNGGTGQLIRNWGSRDGSGVTAASGMEHFVVMVSGWFSKI